MKSVPENLDAPQANQRHCIHWRVDPWFSYGYLGEDEIYKIKKRCIKRLESKIECEKNE